MIKLTDQIITWLDQGKRDGLEERDFFTLGTAKGPVRKENQDRTVFFQVLPHRAKAPISGGVVCDGIATLEDGGRCAQVAIGSLVDCLIHGESNNLVQRLKNSIHHANEIVYHEFKRKAGTTLAAFLFQNSELVYGNVGDSRVHLVSRASKPYLLKQISKDDNLLTALSENNRKFTPEPEHFKLLQYIGVGPELEPHVTAVDWKGYSSVLLTTDGVHNLGAEMLEKILTNGENPGQVMRRILKIAEWTDKDNMTALEYILPNNGVYSQGDCEPNLLQIWQPAAELRLYFSPQHMPPERAFPLEVNKTIQAKHTTKHSKPKAKSQNLFFSSVTGQRKLESS